jgi:phytoene dehydrogenase-like protein
MGALVQALENTATHHNATLWTEANVTQLHLGQEWHNVGFEKNGQQYEVKTRYVLVNASPITLKKLLNEPFLPTDQDEGTAFKVNMLLRRLPRLKADVSPQEAFAGTFHIHQSYSQLQRAFDEAANGQIPSLPPCEIYCHTLTDDSILSPALAQQGYHTLTLFGLDMPYRLFVEKPDATKKQVLAAYLAGINTFLAEPLEDCLARARDGSFCIEAKSAWDLEQEVGLPRGNIFHKELSWFFADDAPSVGQRGVETPHPRLYVCGSSAQRGGAVSGIPGYNAAMKVLA